MNSIFTIFGFIVVIMALMVVVVKETPENANVIYKLFRLIADTARYYFLTWFIVQAYLIAEFIVRTYQEIKFVSNCKKPKLPKNYEPDEILWYYILNWALERGSAEMGNKSVNETRSPKQGSSHE